MRIAWAAALKQVTHLERAVQLFGEDSWHFSKNMLVHAYRMAGDSARFREASRRVVSELERRLAANPTSPELLDPLTAAYAERGDIPGLLRQTDRLRRQVAAQTPGETPASGTELRGGWTMATVLARLGRLDEARSILHGMSDAEPGWFRNLDSLGLPPLPEEPAIRALHRTPEFLALQAAGDARMQALFDRYRPIVAAALPNEPDVPAPRQRWPRNPVP